MYVIYGRSIQSLLKLNCSGSIAPQTVWFDLSLLNNRVIVTAPHRGESVGSMKSSFADTFARYVRAYRSTGLITFALLLSLTQFVFTLTAFAGELDMPAIEKRYLMGSDWVLVMNTSTLEKMLDYPSSQIHPITQVRIVYFLRDRETQNWGQGKLYEDLWFAPGGRPIGSRRYARLPFQMGSYGVIYAARSKDCFNQTRALDDTVLRLYLDLNRLSCVIASVVLPQEICDNAASDLGTFNFYPATMITAGRAILLHFQSSPIAYDKYFIYTIK